MSMECSLKLENAAKDRADAQWQPLDHAKAQEATWKSRGLLPLLMEADHSWTKTLL
jgi:hypothetical protein